MSTTNLESVPVGATSDETKELSHFQDGKAVVDLVADIKPEKTSEDADGSGVMTRNAERRRRQSHSSSGSLRGSVLYAANAAKDLAHASVLKPTLLGPTQCSAIVVNYISTGYILLPYAFYSAGILYSIIVFAVVALQSYVSTIFILETCARAESLNWLSSSGALPQRYSMSIREMQYELTGLHHIFLGSRLVHIFTATTALDLYSISWLIAAIFGQALASQVPTDFDGYKLWVGCFMVITIPLSCTKVLDQALLQYIFLGGRMLMVILMLGTLVAAFVSDGEHFAGSSLGAEPVGDAPFFDVKNTMTIVQTAIFSTAFQFSVPAMAGLSDDKKDSMSGVFRHAVIFVYISNCLLALMMALYFRSDVNPSSNLNWASYVGGSHGWSKLVSGYIVMFAALDGLAIFPLLSSTLGGILLQAVFGEKALYLEDDFKLQVIFRLLAAVPPSIGALFVQDLGVVAKYGCIFTLLSYSAAPALLFVASGKIMIERNIPHKTYYFSKYFSHNWLAYGILVLTLLAILGIVLDSSLLG